MFEVAKEFMVQLASLMPWVIIFWVMFDLMGTLIFWRD